MARQKIIDEFTDLPVSRQRKRQMRMKRDGRCVICGKPRINATHCRRHSRSAVHWTQKSTHKHWEKRQAARALARKTGRERPTTP